MGKAGFLQGLGINHRDGSRHTIKFARDNVRISACRACGKIRQVDATVGFCGTRSCMTRRLVMALTEAGIREVVDGE
jgi:hypothetical protein